MHLPQDQIDSLVDIRNLPTEEQVEEEAISRSTYSFGIYRISKIEDKKFWLMASAFGLIAYIYSVIREIKDAFIIIRQVPASIHVLKLFWVPPIAMIGTLIVQKLLVENENKTVLKYLVFFFGVYFIFYAGISYPWSFSLEPNTQGLKDAFADGKMKYKGVESILAVLFTIYAWTSTMHFIAAEIWGSLVLSFLFMSFANDVCPLKQFLRFMPLLYILSNIAVVMSAATMYGMQRFLSVYSYFQCKLFMCAIFILFGILCFIVYICLDILDKKVLNKPLYIVAGVQKKKKKVKVEFGEAIKLMLTSKLVLSICAIVLFYNISTNMAESSYKSVLRIRADLLSSGNEDYVMFRQFITQLITGLAVIALLITPFSRLIIKIGWTFVGLLPPVFAGSSSFILFMFAIYNTGYSGNNIWGFINDTVTKMPILHVLTKNFKENHDPLWLEESFGVIVVALYKVCKYAAFDMTKEAISMKIDSKYRSRFKGVYDGICGRLGKAFGAVISMIVTIFCSTTDIRRASGFYLIVSLMFTCLWCYLIVYLGNKYDDSIKNNKNIDIDVIGGKAGLEE